MYQHFIKTIRMIEPLRIVTTNVDECLEKNLPGTSTIQRSDLERCTDLIGQQVPFLCKLHGSVSAMQSVVFTKDDYDVLVKDPRYLLVIRQLFTQCCVVFVGYSLGDQYVLELLANNSKLREIFGDGPHFLISSDPATALPSSLNVIRYKPEPHRDHRTVIQVLEIVSHVRKFQRIVSGPPSPTADMPPLMSAHFISDIYPPGTWTTSQAIEAGRAGKETPISIIRGPGWTNSEQPSTESTAMHDLVVGLLCFDFTYCPLACVDRVHYLLGDQLFWELVNSGAIRFVHWDSEEAIIFPTVASISGGMLGHIKPKTTDRRDQTRKEVVHSYFTAAPGKEAEAEALLETLENRTEFIDSTKQEPNLEMSKSLLLLPQIKEQLGLSDGTPLESIPRWMAFSILRVVNIVKVASTCQALGIASTKLLFGCAGLAAPALSAASSDCWADDEASYVLTGRYHTDLGKFVLQDPSILRAVLAFRETQPGVTMRTDLLRLLAFNPGSELVVCIGGGLRSTIPPRILQEARDAMSGLLLAHSLANSKPTPAVWTDMNYSEAALARWRRRSAEEFHAYCEAASITQYDLCPCGSGEKRRFCCEEALRK
ncbi:MAG: SIR2 family NAD-dependent protein deacylase [Candidatus Acidiferrales bacterium]